MDRLAKSLVVPFVVLASFASAAWARNASLAESSCVTCHGTADLWDEDTKHLFVTPEDLAADVHWQKGISCHDCHGGNSDTFELRQAHAIEDGFRKIESPVDVPDFCGHCHSNAEYMQARQPGAATDQVERFWASVHGQHLKETEGSPEAASCISCHAPHQMTQAEDPPSAVAVQRVVDGCGRCHQQQLIDLRKSVHARAGVRGENGAGTLLDCRKCHGDDVHGMLSVDQSESPVFLDHQVRVCGGCHEKYLETYQQSVHGRGLMESGLLVTAVCSDCHGAHGTFYAADRRSTLHPDAVATTCGTCHRFIEERLEKSVHGSQGNPNLAQGSFAGKKQRKPSCTDCHPGHDQPHPESGEFRLELPYRCGNCHAELSDRYRMSLHGELTQLGYVPAAECADCHGAHDVLPVQSPQSRMSAANRVETCRQCHPRAVVNFAGFDPHASHKDEARYPLLYGVYAWTGFLLNLLFGIFVIHSFLWFARSFVHALTHGRHRRLATQQIAVRRFRGGDRAIYLLLLVSFLGLVLTGLPLKNSSEVWAQRLAEWLGSFDATQVWHHFFALTIFCAGTIHLVRAVKRLMKRRESGTSWKSLVFGPDSRMFNRRDLRDLTGMLRWFFGMGNKPKFERWTYWEKVDYWALYVCMVMIGLSGAVLWFPNLFCSFLPGYVLNLAKMIHAEMALTIGGFIFVIHVFNTHLRPEKFPMDLSVFTGLVSEEHLQEARPEYLERLRSQGMLEARRTATPSRRRLRVIAWTSFAILAVGLVLLAMVLFAKLGK